MRVASSFKVSCGLAAVGAVVCVGGCSPGPVEVGREPVAPVVPAVTPPASVAVPAPAEAAADVSQSDVIGWTVRGVTDDVILDRIDRARSTFHLSAGDEMRLRDAGVSDDVIRAMKATVWN